MTSYHGGKKRFGKEIAKIIYVVSLGLEDEYGFEIKGYCEPFCGMCGVYEHIPSLFNEDISNMHYKAGDINKSVILMWKKAQKGWKPSAISKTKYERLKGNGDSSAEKGFVGHTHGFGGQYFGTYRKGSPSHSSKSVSRIAKNLKQVQFSHNDYKKYSNLKGYVIYCDPPYQVVNRYFTETDEHISFDNVHFWNWCRKMAKDNIIFVSEYSAPKDFTCIGNLGDVKGGHYRGRKTTDSEKLYFIKK